MSALEVETNTLIGAMDGTSDFQVASIAGCSGNLDGRHVAIVRAGLGKVNTATAVGLLFERYRPEVFVFSGVAGGLSLDLGIGDVVIGERTIQHDAGVIEPEGLRRYQAGHIPFFNPTDEFGFSPSRQLLDRIGEVTESIRLEPVVGRTPRVVLGTILTGDQYLHDEATRRELHRELGAAAIEMEGAAMAQAAQMVGVEHLVVRSLSDLAGADSVTDFGRFVAEVAVNSARVVRALIPVL